MAAIIMTSVKTKSTNTNIFKVTVYCQAANTKSLVLDLFLSVDHPQEKKKPCSADMDMNLANTSK